MTAYPRHARHVGIARSLDLRQAIKANAGLETIDELNALAVQLRAATAAKIHVIYAVLRREYPAVKIGYSRHLAGKTGRLNKMPGCRLVALTPGSRDDEAIIHARLAAHRIRLELPGSGVTEHFELTPPVVDWINEARANVNLVPVTREQLLAYSSGARACSPSA